MPVIQQLFFAHMLILEGATFRLMPAAKLIGRDPRGRAGEFLLVQPLQRIGVGLLLLFKIAPLSVLLLEHVASDGRLLGGLLLPFKLARGFFLMLICRVRLLLYGLARQVRWEGARSMPTGIP